jgi:hypothetical protein
MPVWAEFSVFEGQATPPPGNATGGSGRVAKGKPAKQR